MEEQTIQQHPPVSFGEWMVTLIISMVPLVNIVMFFVWAFGSDANPSKANWAKAALIISAIVIILYIVFFIMIFSTISSLAF